jgi:tRNA U34 5-carboxymethylaminomethyl modifying enzyme MnmG/GidA
VIQIVGGGAAGCEAAWGLATRGIACRLVTTTLDALYALPAEVWPAPPPAGTLWAAVAAEASDPGGGGTRAATLRRAVKRDLERLPALSVLQSNVVALQRDGDAVVGVRTWEGPVLRADATVLAVGTFLAPRLRVGRAEERSGRLGEMAYDELRDDLAAAGARFVRRRLAVAGDGVTPAHEVAFDAFDPEGTAPLRVDDRPVPGVRAWPGHAGLWLLGACAEPVDVDGAAAAGRDLAAHLASAAPGP